MRKRTRRTAAPSDLGACAVACSGSGPTSSLSVCHPGRARPAAPRSHRLRISVFSDPRLSSPLGRMTALVRCRGARDRHRKCRRCAALRLRRPDRSPAAAPGGGRAGLLHRRVAPGRGGAAAIRSVGPLGAGHAAAARRAGRAPRNGRRTGLRLASRDPPCGRGLRPPPGRRRVGRPLAAAGRCRGAGPGAAGGSGAELGDHENLGGIFRNAAGLRGRRGPARQGMRRPAVPALRARASIGTPTTVPWTRVASLDEVREQGFALFALTPAGDAKPLDAVAWPERYAVLLGLRGRACRRIGWRRPTQRSDPDAPRRRLPQRRRPWPPSCLRLA